MTFVETGQTLELKHLLKHSCIIYSHELDEKMIEDRRKYVLE